MLDKKAASLMRPLFLFLDEIERVNSRLCYLVSAVLMMWLFRGLVADILQVEAKL